MRLFAKVSAVILFTLFSNKIIFSQVISSSNRAEELRYAKSLFDNKMYAEAEKEFEDIYKKYSDEISLGYSVLCSVMRNSHDYENRIVSFEKKYPHSGILNIIYFKHAANLFAAGDYEASSRIYDMVDEKVLTNKEKPEFYFKKGYGLFRKGLFDEAYANLEKVENFPVGDYTSPSRYACGYINYEHKKFSSAIEWFEKIIHDGRFRTTAQYYIAECRFMLKDYSYIVNNAAYLESVVPPERKEHFSRIASESFLIMGNTAKAKEYYDKFNGKASKNRNDYFYSGTLLFNIKDYAGAVKEFSKMENRTDSLGQIAEYQMGYSYIKLKNKVNALQSFKEASKASFDPKIREDAMFNYAKLSFDLNKDGSVFKEYMSMYNSSEKNDVIYSYQALSALYDRDYAGAIDAYDKIDNLDDGMQSNYVKANYLRAAQMVEIGAYRNAIPCLKTVIYYSGKFSVLGQLSKYWLAESHYRSGNYEEARKIFTELYNISALDGKNEGKLIAYNIAYCCMGNKDYEGAMKWFGTYLDSSPDIRKKDAMVKLADCDFAMKNYKSAAEKYERAFNFDTDADDIYPYYQAGIAYGLIKDNAKKTEMLSHVTGASERSYLYPEAMNELAKCYLEKKDNAGASECYEKLIKAGIDSTVTAKALFGLGLIEKNSGNYDKALGHYKRIVLSMPQSEYAEDAMNAINAIYVIKQEPGEYLAFVESIGKDYKGTIDKESVLFNSAEQIYLAGNHSKALSVLLSYIEKYPEGANVPKSCFYVGEIYRESGNGEKACDYYKMAFSDETDVFAENAALNYADLSYAMEYFKQAYSGYEKLLSIAKFPENKVKARVGMMNSAYKSKDYDAAVQCADNLVTDKKYGIRASFIKAKSMLAKSKRKEALGIFSQLAKNPDSPEGSESVYILIMDKYDRGKFGEVEKDVTSIRAKSMDRFWLAKCFIVLGDAYVEMGNISQAKATFLSIKENYDYENKEAIIESVNMRIEKLKQLEK